MRGWNEILGHRRVLSVLERAIDNGRLHHAFLFTGPDGVGKASLAYTLTAALNCTRGDGEGFQPPCGTCPTCRRIAANQHPDLHVLEPTGRTVRTLKIDAVRGLQKVLVSTPYEARRRVVLLNDAHLMTEEAANALLKTLEEPPDRTLLILVTDQPQRLLDTIRSRCQRLRFGRLPRELVTASLPELWPSSFDLEEGEEPPELPPAELFSVAAGYGEGSPGRSLEVLKSGVLESRRELLERVLGLEAGSPVSWLNEADWFSDSGANLRERLDILMVFFRDVLLHHHGHSARAVNEDLPDLIQRGARRFSTEATLALLDAILAAKYRLNGYVSAQLVAEDLVARLQSPERYALTPPA